MLKYFITSIFTILLFGSPVGATTVTVCSECIFKTVAGGIEAASPHDTLSIEKGTYYEHEVLVDKPLVILAEKGAVLDGEMKGGIMVIKADSVTLKGLTIRNVGVSFTKDYAAIKLNRCSDFILENNILENVFFGIFIEKSRNGLVKWNRISSNAEEEMSSGNGIHLWYCNNITIEANETFGVRDGIYLEFVDDSRVIHNSSHDNIRYGLHFMFSNRDEYSQNTFKKNGAGVAVMFSKHIKMTDNIFIKNWGTASYGLLLKEINDAEITGNIFEKNTIGINIEGSNRINYTNNQFKSNGWAMYIRGGCYKNIVKSNDFMNNTFEVSYKGKMNDNLFDRNYWSTYTGYDLDKDGIGDVPYRPVKLFSYVVGENPATIILLRSLFVDLINFSEKVTPVFTPDNMKDNYPLMKANHDQY
ncbi:MAG: nitrous oxide reductase family maturation protein NosD [Bacteroidetes bacterium]|nr:nitrous oxide reductase family maturation protein NosD [Bacteroidota bacterium]